MMDVIQPLAAVVLVLGLLGGSLWLLKRRGAAQFRLPGLPRSLSRASAEMEVVERVALNAQCALHLVRVGEKKFVVSTSPSSCALVAEVGQ